MQLWAFPTSHRVARFSGIKLNSRSSIIFWARCFAVSARPNLSGAKFESIMHADLYPVASSLFRIGLFHPSNTNLSCSFARGVLTALVFVFASRFTDDEWCVSQVKFNVQVLSSSIGRNSKHAVSTTEDFSRSESPNPSGPMSFTVSLDSRSLSIFFESIV